MQLAFPRQSSRRDGQSRGMKHGWAQALCCTPRHLVAFFGGYMLGSQGMTEDHRTVANQPHEQGVHGLRRLLPSLLVKGPFQGAFKGGKNPALPGHQVSVKI